MPATEQTYDVAIVGGGPAGMSTALHVHAAAPGAASSCSRRSATRATRSAPARSARARSACSSESASRSTAARAARRDRAAGRRATPSIVREPRLGVVVRRIEFDHALAASRARAASRCATAARCAIAIGDGGVRSRPPLASCARARSSAPTASAASCAALGFPRGELRAQVVELDTEAIAGDPARHARVRLHGARSARLRVGLPDAGRRRAAGVPRRRTAAARERIATRARARRYLAARGLDVGDYPLKQFAERGFEPGAPIAAPRVLLVGEAAGIDIATGEGIAQAIEYGALAGGYLAARSPRRLRVRRLAAAYAKSKVGIDLRIRHFLLPYYFGKHRAWFERYFQCIRNSWPRAWNQFAGRHVSQLTWARATASAMWGAASGTLRGLRGLKNLQRWGPGRRQRRGCTHAKQ